jgi:hypothetical protein
MWKVYINLDFSDGFGGDLCITLPVIREYSDVAGDSIYHVSRLEYQAYMAPPSIRPFHPSSLRLV